MLVVATEHVLQPTSGPLALSLLALTIKLGQGKVPSLAMELLAVVVGTVLTKGPKLVIVTRGRLSKATLLLTSPHPRSMSHVSVMEGTAPRQLESRVQRVSVPPTPLA